MLYSPFKRLKSTHSRLTHVFLASISLFLLATIPLLTTPDSLFPAIAQTTDARQLEADRLLLQGLQQYQTSQLRAALNSWQQALQIYRALKNREGEGGTLGKLMQSFYQNLQNNPDKAQALRQAMLATMKTHPQPRNWAAFTLIGEAE